MNAPEEYETAEFPLAFRNLGRAPLLRFYFLGLALLVGLADSGCRRLAAEDASEGTRVPSVILAVSAARVTVRPMRHELNLIGTTAALRTLTLRAPAAGRIVGLLVQTGDLVQRGQVLAHIISREDEAALAGVAAARKIDPGEAAAIESSVKRYSSGPGIPVHVPEGAVVSRRLVSSGQVVNELDPLVDLVDPHSVYVDAQAPINQLAVLNPGMDATVTSALSPSARYPARIWSLSPNFSAGGTTEPVWVEFTTANRITQIGASVEVHVTTGVVPNAIVVPTIALFQDAQRDNFYVFVVGSDGQAHRTIVAIGIRTPSEVQVTKGLKPGDVVITSGGYALSDGLAVRASVSAQEAAESNTPNPGSD